MAFFYSPRSIHLGDVSEANGRERPWQTQNAQAYVAFEIKDFVNSRKLWFLKNLCGYLRDRHTLKSHQNVIHSPVKKFLLLQSHHSN